MFFSNLIAYKFKSELPLKFDAEQLQADLSQDAFRHTTAQELATMGWTKAFGRYGETLAHHGDGYILLCVRREEKLLPATIINGLVGEDVAAIELAEGRQVRKRERDEIKEKILFELLPQALVKTSQQYALIDLERGYLVVNSGSFNLAEELAALLRKSLGTLPITPVFAGIDLDVHLTDWLTTGKPPAGFVIGGDVDLVEADDRGAQVKFKGHDLACDEVKSHLESGKRVTKLQLHWNDRVTFVMQSDGAIKRLSYSDTIREENADIPKEDMAVKLDADFLLCATEVTELVTELVAINAAEEVA